MLHTSLLINGILYSTEALFKLNNQHIDKLMACERDLLCKVWDCPRTVPTEALYIEGNITPLKFILIGRRLMFYWTILNKPKHELVRQVFDAMSEFPRNKEDWLSLVKQDLRYLEIDFSDSYIQLMTKCEFQKLVKTKIKDRKREYLKGLQDKHSKTKRLTVENSSQAYLSTKLLSTSQKQFLFLLRCKMTKNKSHFKNQFPNLICRLCLDVNSEESLIHFCDCSFIKQHIPEISHVSVDDIYGEIDDQVKAVEVFMKIFLYIEEAQKDQAHTKCASCTD